MMQPTRRDSTKRTRSANVVLTVLTTACLISSTRGAGAPAQALPAEALPAEAAIEAELSDIVANTGIPGMTFAVYGRHLRRSLAAGYADRESKTPMRPDSVMMGASTGKMLVAVLAYQEARRGRLHYSDKVSRFFSPGSAYHRLPGASRLTISMLLRHSTGLVDGAVDYAAIADSSGTWTNERRFRAARKTKLLFAPGSAYSYSDLNYQILAAVIESLEGHYFGDLAMTRIVTILGMSGTHAATSQTIRDLASGYAGPTTKPQYEGIKLPNKTADAGRLFMNPAFEGGGGGFSTTSPDMARFIYGLYNSNLVGPDELAYMTSGPIAVSPDNDDVKYGAGLFIYKTELGAAMGHPGLWFGYKTLVLYYPSACVGAAMQVNSQIDGEGNDLSRYRVDGKSLGMAATLTALVQKELHAAGERSDCDQPH